MVTALEHARDVVHESSAPVRLVLASVFSTWACDSEERSRAPELPALLRYEGIKQRLEYLEEDMWDAVRMPDAPAELRAAASNAQQKLAAALKDARTRLGLISK